MSDLLSALTSPEQLQNYNIEQQKLLAEQLRQRIISTVASNGGHLASNLGMVELTIALLAEFNFSLDQIVFDVGHQCYTWKLLTGRDASFETLRQKDGLSGFPKRSESKYDFFNTGHSSTSISAALGISRALDRTGKGGHVIAVVGDGALTGGMAFEALNDAGQSQENLIVVLNDNQMSIGKNVGGLSSHLEKLRISRRYLRMKTTAENILQRIPLIGRPICGVIRRLKSMDRLWLRNSGVFFEQLGFRYYGPIDGHNLQELKKHLSAIHEIKGPVLLHIITQKGKGYDYAEKAPDQFHGVAPFVIESGVCKPGADHCNQTFSAAFGNILTELAANDPKICAVSAAMTAGTGLSGFAKTYPARFFDVGIAEQHALTMSAGLAAGGMKPCAALYSTFLQRGIDQLLHDICLQKLPVVLTVDRAGLVGEDGETHQGIYDLGMILPLPYLEIICPLDERTLKWSLEYGLRSDHPVAIRYPRSSMPDNASSIDNEDPAAGLFRTISGRDCTILAVGVLFEAAGDAAGLLAEDGISCDVFAVYKVKPFNYEAVMPSLRKTGRLMIVQDGLNKGGFADYILPDILAKIPDLKFVSLGVQEEPLDQASRFELLADQGLDAEGIASSLCKFLNS